MFIHTTKKKCSLMDKNLKKLSRVELLQLMVQLSEDRDALFAENTELRKRAAERPTAATSMKVGSIAEAALQANGYFESAQNAADEYLREIKRMRDQVAARTASAGAAAGKPKARVDAQSLPTPQIKTTQQAQPASQAQPVQQVELQAQQAQSLEQQIPVVQQSTATDQQYLDKLKADAVQEAKAMSDRILARANAQSKAIIDDAQARADAIIADANRKSHTIVSRENRQAEAVLGAAQQKAASKLPEQQDVEEQKDQAPRNEVAKENPSGPSAQQQVSSRQDETTKSPSTTAEIATRARHVRNPNRERL